MRWKLESVVELSPLPFPVIIYQQSNIRHVSEFHGSISSMNRRMHWLHDNSFGTTLQLKWFSSASPIYADFYSISIK